MRRVVPVVLVGLGAFLLVATVLIKFYAYPKLAVAPADQDSVTRLAAEDAIVFETDPTLLTEIRTDLDVVSTTRGDVEASEEASEDAGDEVLVWVGTQTVTDDGGTIRSQSRDRTAFDAHTSEAVDCCDNFVEDQADERTPVQRDGIVYKFPFDAEKKTYAWWDSEIADTVDMEYVEETEIDGLTVYKYEGAIPPTVVGTREVPAGVAGEPGTDNVVTDSVYANKRTFWIEPNTGVIIDRQEEQRSTLEFNGEERVIQTEANLSYTDEQVQTNADDWKSKARLLGLIDGILPWFVALLGLVLIALGLFLSARGRSDDAPAGGRSSRTAPREPVSSRKA